MNIDLHPALKAAIKNYFDKKFHDGTGGFKEGEKEPAVAAIREACKTLKFGWEIVPGLVCIHFVGGSLWFDRKNQRDRHADDQGYKESLARAR